MSSSWDDVDWEAFPVIQRSPSPEFKTFGEWCEAYGAMQKKLTKTPNKTTPPAEGPNVSSESLAVQRPLSSAVADGPVTDGPVLQQNQPRGKKMKSKMSPPENKQHQGQST